MEWLKPEILVALVTLIALELVLGVDNVIFISILASKLPKEQQARARTVGIALAVVTRIMLLFSLSFIANLTQPLVTLAGVEFSGRDIILLLGGLFLIFKSVQEIHQKLEGEEGHTSKRVAATFNAVIVQIILLDIVFSLDSVITAVGMVNEIAIMVIAVIAAAGVMIFAASPISKFVDERPTIKMLALSFLLLIGFTLAIEAFEVHVPKGYIYFAMGFAVFVEMLNLRLRGRAEHPVKLRKRIVADAPETATGAALAAE
ncbi:TerC family protein [Anaerolineae bacterium CFX7]|nr:TerC family protein [Anaerolineae bacterium CFX7]